MARVAVVEHDRLRIARAPVLVEDVGAVGGGEKCHDQVSSGVRLGCLVQDQKGGRSGPGRHQCSSGYRRVHRTVFRCGMERIGNSTA